MIEVATDMRDEFGYDFLTTVPAWITSPEGKLEVVYNLFRTTGGPA